MNRRLRASYLKRKKKEKGGGGSGQNKRGVYHSDVVMLSGAVKETDKIREMNDERIDLVDGRWISYLSREYSFLDGMLAILENSGTLSAVIEQKMSLVVGGGMIPIKGGGGFFSSLYRKFKEVLGIKDKAVVEISEFLSDINQEGDDLLEVIGRAVNDYESMGNIFLEMVKGVDDEGEDGRFFYLNHWDVVKCKIKKEKIDDDGKVVEVRKVGYSEEWEKDPRGNNAHVVPVYPEWEEMDDGTERSVIHVKRYMRGFKYWGVPEWLAVRKWVELEYRVAMHNVSRFINGYLPSAIVQFFGAKNKTEAKGIVDDFKENFTDTGNNSKMFIQVLSDEKLKANVQIIEDKSDGSFMELTKLSVQRIVTGLRWAMSIAGVEQGGKLGSNQQVAKEYERVNNMVIVPIREKILKCVVNPFMEEVVDHLEKPEWEGINLIFGNNSIFSLIDSIKVDDVLTLNERREVIGYGSIPDDEKDSFFEEKKKMKESGLSGKNK